LYAGQHPNVTHFLGATFYPPRSSILIACEFMDLRSFKDIMKVCGASQKVTRRGLQSQRVWLR